METDRLRYFCTIFETGSFTKAASILGLSHSALSKAMSVLQSELEIELFKPVGRGIEPTPAAHDVYQKSKDILQKLNTLKTKEPSAPSPIKIGFSEMLGLSLAGLISKVIDGPYSLFELDAGDVETAILHKEIDFGFTVIPFPHKELEYLKVSKLRLGQFRRKGSFRDVSADQIPFVVPLTDIKDNPLSVKTRDNWPPQAPRLVSFGASSMTHALEIVKAGKACIYIPEILAHSIGRTSSSDTQLEKVPSTERFPASNRSMDLFLVKHIHRDEDKVMKMISKEIRKLCQE